MLLNLEGEDHHRLRRLLNPAFSPKLIGGLVPRFQALANELIDVFHSSGECEFVSQFAEPYAARVIAIMLGIPEEEWRTIAAWSAEIGLGLDHEVDCGPSTEGSSYTAETSPFAELPLTLGDAIAAFERNKVVRGCMPEELATQYIAVKSDEWARACGAVTDFDREMYLEYL